MRLGETGAASGLVFDDSFIPNTFRTLGWNLNLFLETASWSSSTEENLPDTTLFGLAAFTKKEKKPYIRSGKYFWTLLEANCCYDNESPSQSEPPPLNLRVSHSSHRCKIKASARATSALTLQNKSPESVRKHLAIRKSCLSVHTSWMASTFLLFAWIKKYKIPFTFIYL